MMDKAVLRQGKDGSRMKTIGKVGHISGPSLVPFAPDGSWSTRRHDVMFSLEFTRNQFRSLMKARMCYTRYLHLVLYDSGKTILSFPGQIVDVTDIKESEDVATANITIGVLGSIVMSSGNRSQDR